MADWFAAKRYGYGSGLPIAWQGWVVMIGYLATIAGSIALFHDRPVVILAVTFFITPVFVLIVYRTTRGGWRWRWGEKD